MLLVPESINMEVQAAFHSSFFLSHPSQGHLKVARAPTQILRIMRLCPEKSGNLLSETHRESEDVPTMGKETRPPWLSDTCFVLSLGMGAVGRDWEDVGFGLD